MANRLFGSILCWLGFHDFHVITESFSFGGGGIETVECHQPLNSIQILAAEWLLLGKSGHSPLGISRDLSGCFRPEAAIAV